MNFDLRHVKTTAEAPPQQDFDLDRFKSQCQSRLPHILQHLLPNGKIKGEEFVCGDLYGSPGDSCSFSLNKNTPGLGGEFNGGKMFGDFIDLWQHVKNCDFQDAVKDIGDYISVQTSRKPVQSVAPATREVVSSKKHIYKDENNEVICYVMRKEFKGGDKTFYPVLPSGEKKFPQVRPLYNRENIATCSTEDMIVLVEGEKCVDALREVGITATTAMAGSNAPVSKTDWSPLDGRNVVIWPDNAESGLKYSTAAASHLLTLCNTVRVLQPEQGKPKGWDAADAIAEGFDIESFLYKKDTDVKIINLLDDSLSVSQYKEGQAPQFEYLLDNTLPRGVAGVIAAAGDTGKGMLTLDLGLKLAYGKVGYDTAFDATLRQNGSVVMLTAEDEAAEIHRRIEGVDFDGRRFSETGYDLKILPFPNYGGVRPIVIPTRKGFEATEEWEEIIAQIKKIDDLVLVVIDPLASFVYVDINADPAAGAFVTGHFARLAAETNATWLLVHHMAKMDMKNPVTTPEHARNLIRGTSAIVDGLRFAFALWTPPESEMKHLCKMLRIDFKRNKIVNGAVVKSNGPADREIRTFVRNSHSGLLEGRSSDLQLARRGRDYELDELILCIKQAALEGKPFTQTGKANGIGHHKERLTPELQEKGINHLEKMVQTLIDQDKIVKASAPGMKPRVWLDIPDGPFATGLGEFEPGS